jgi:tetratricopeptide (TPR) repeat protein
MQKSVMGTCGRAVVAVVALLFAAPVARGQSTDAEANFNAGLAHMREGRTALALEEFKRAVGKDSKNPYFFKGLGLAYAGQRKFDDAIEAFRKALAINPYYVDARNDLGTALILAGKRQEGKAEFLAAFNDPTNPTPELSSRNLGQAYFEEKNYAEAYNWFRTSVNRNKSYPDAYLGLTDSLLNLGRLEEAIVHLETAVKEIPEAPALRLALGEAYFKAGRFGEARAALEEARRKDPVGRTGRRATEVLKQFPAK